jgi:hypothetical protein
MAHSHLNANSYEQETQRFETRQVYTMWFETNSLFCPCQPIVLRHAMAADQADRQDEDAWMSRSHPGAGSSTMQHHRSHCNHRWVRLLMSQPYFHHQPRRRLTALAETDTSAIRPHERRPFSRWRGEEAAWRTGSEMRGVLNHDPGHMALVRQESAIGMLPGRSMLRTKLIM